MKHVGAHISIKVQADIKEKQTHTHTNAQTTN